MHRRHTHIAHERGTAMVEMALVLPILLFLALAVVDFGRALNYWNDTNQIAADGARFAAVGRNPGGDGVTFKQWLSQQADTPELEFGDQSAVDEGHKSTLGPLQVRICAPDGGTVGNPVVIKVSTRFNLLPFLNRNPGASDDHEVLDPQSPDDPDAEEGTFGTLDIRGRATMRLEKNWDALEMGALDDPSECT